MRVVKRYPNRKLYDTVTKQYVALEAIADMIRRGESVQVIDNATGDDHTTLILSQIIVEQEKRGDGFLPLEILTALIQAGGVTLTGLRRRLCSPLDLLRQIDDEQALESALRARGLPTRGDVSLISSLLDELTAELDRLHPGSRDFLEQASNCQHEAEDQ